MDPAASNYNPSATASDGSCVYPNYCFEVTGGMFRVLMDQASCNLYNGYDYTATETYFCGTSYSSCDSDRQSFVNEIDTGTATACIDVGGTTPFWYQYDDQGSCTGSDYGYGRILDVGPVSDCNSVAPVDSCI